MILLGLEKHDDALKSFDRASELEPESAQPYQQRAELYRQKGDLEKAVEQLTKALELAPDNVATLLIRSAVLYELKQTDKALADVDKAIQVAHRARPALLDAPKSMRQPIGWMMPSSNSNRFCNRPPAMSPY